MFTAYNIRVVVSLTNQVSGALTGLARDFIKTDAEAKRLQSTLKEIKLLGIGGMIGIGVGIAGLDAVAHMLKPASEYTHQLNIMNNLGMSHADIAESVGVAWQTTHDVITSTATGNLRALVDLRNILADVNKENTSGNKIDMGMAERELAPLLRIQAVMMASSIPGVAARGKDDQFIYTMAKALDIIGAATDPTRFTRESEEMGKAIEALQGRIAPEAFRSAFVYARQERFGLSDEFKYEFGLPTMLQEYNSGGGAGGGQRGVGPMLAALNRYVVQGIGINKMTGPLLDKLGLLPHGWHEKTIRRRGWDEKTGLPLKTMTNTTTVGALKDYQLGMEKSVALDNASPYPSY